MIWIAFGAALLAFFVWLGRNPQVGGRGQWRAAAAVLAVALLVGGAAAALRGSWPLGIILMLASVALATLSRRPPRLTPGASRLSEADARRILGVSPEAEAEEIQAAYVRLMRKVHPDAGGAEGLAAQLNAARERLLRDR